MRLSFPVMTHDASDHARGRMTIDPTKLTFIQLSSAIPLDGETKPTVKSVTNLSPDSVKRHYRHLLNHPTPRRTTMTLGNAIDIAAGRAVRKG